MKKKLVIFNEIQLLQGLTPSDTHRHTSVVPQVHTGFGSCDLSVGSHCCSPQGHLQRWGPQNHRGLSASTYTDRHTLTHCLSASPHIDKHTLTGTQQLQTHKTWNKKWNKGQKQPKLKVLQLIFSEIMYQRLNQQDQITKSYVTQRSLHYIIKQFSVVCLYIISRGRLHKVADSPPQPCCTSMATHSILN